MSFGLLFPLFTILHVGIAGEAQPRPTIPSSNAGEKPPRPTIPLSNAGERQRRPAGHISDAIFEEFPKCKVGQNLG